MPSFSTRRNAALFLPARATWGASPLSTQPCGGGVRDQGASFWNPTSAPSSPMPVEDIWRDEASKTTQRQDIPCSALMAAGRLSQDLPHSNKGISSYPNTGRHDIHGFPRQGGTNGELQTLPHPSRIVVPYHGASGEQGNMDTSTLSPPEGCQRRPAKAEDLSRILTLVIHKISRFQHKITLTPRPRKS